MFRIAVTLLAAVTLTGPALTQSVWYVDDDNCPGPGDGSQGNPFCKIQNGIDAAVSGDTVLVLPGTYVENIDYGGKAITVRSDADGDPATADILAHATIIDGNQAGSVVTFQNDESSSSVLRGLTLTNGSGTPGSSYSAGGGIYCYAASPTILDNIISGNTADIAGGISCMQQPCAPTIRGNTIARNTAPGNIHFAGFGGGISCWTFSSPYIVGNTIAENSSDYGGGISCHDNASPLIVNNLLLNNSAASGGAIGLSGLASASMVNSTLAHNSATGFGGAIFCRHSDFTVVNSILWDDSAATGAEIYVGLAGEASTVNISYCDVDGGLPSTHVDTGCNLNWGPGMIDSDPRFVDLDGTDDDIDTWEDNDVHLTARSPAIDAGDTLAPILPADDLEGDPRRFDVPGVPDTGAGSAPIVDMGADEFHRHLYYRGDASPGGTLELKFVDLPATPVWCFWISVRIRDLPVTTSVGDWYLLPPLWYFSLGGALTSADGVLLLSGSLPPAPGPYAFHLQAALEDPPVLTNPCTVNVK